MPEDAHKLDTNNPHADALKSAETLYESYCKKDANWERHAVESGVTIDLLHDPALPLPVFRGNAIYDAISPLEYYSVVRNKDLRFLWDERFEKGQLIARLDDKHALLVHPSMKGHLFVSPRDFCIAVDTHFEHDTQGNVNRILSVFVSVKDDRVPLVSGYVRGHIYLSAWDIRLDEHGKCCVSYVTAVDVNGYIPRWMLNKVMVHTPVCVSRIVSVLGKYGAPPFVINRHGLIVQDEHYVADTGEWKGYIAAESNGKNDEAKSKINLMLVIFKGNDKWRKGWSVSIESSSGNPVEATSEFNNGNVMLEFNSDIAKAGDTFVFVKPRNDNKVVILGKTVSTQ